MPVTQNQRNAAETLVRRMQEKNHGEEGRAEKAAAKLFYYILRVLAEDIEKYGYPESSCREFTTSINMGVRIVNLVDNRYYTYLEVGTVKEAKQAMKEVVNIFNELPHYRAKFYPNANNKKGTMTVYVDLNKE